MDNRDKRTRLEQRLTKARASSRIMAAILTIPTYPNSIVPRFRVGQGPATSDEARVGQKRKREAANPDTDSGRYCETCGSKFAHHDPWQCPKLKKCLYCKRTGHWSVQCTDPHHFCLFAGCVVPCTHRFFAALGGCPWGPGYKAPQYISQISQHDFDMHANNEDYYPDYPNSD